MELTYDCSLDIMLYLETNLKLNGNIDSVKLVKALNRYSETYVLYNISQLLNSGYISALSIETLASTAYIITDITPAGHAYINDH